MRTRVLALISVGAVALALVSVALIAFAYNVAIASPPDDSRPMTVLAPGPFVTPADDATQASSAGRKT